MNVRQRFRTVMEHRLPPDRLPMVEWAAWWDKTIDGWLNQGLSPQDDFRRPKGFARSLDRFGLDPMYCILARPIGPGCPSPAAHGAGILTNAAEYRALLPDLYLDSAIDELCRQADALSRQHTEGSIIVRLWLDGFFWFPRSLLGIENHFFALYDQPGLILQMNEDLTEFHQRTLNRLLNYLQPDMVGFAEDMSYNHGPMLSESLFTAQIAPFYRQLVPTLKQAGMRVLVDSDGKIEPLLPWLTSCGIEGIYPLERQSGVDANAIRQQYPDLIMLGGFDKRVIHLGEAAIRSEFERLLPVMKTGGFIPSVDHQTPPDVTLADYEQYIRLFKEYAVRAVQP